LSAHIKLNKVLIERIAKPVRKGVPLKEAASVVGIDNRTLKNWLAVGANMRAIVHDTGGFPKGSGKHEWLCAELSEVVEQAHSSVVQRYSQAIDTAVKRGTWSAAAWWLDRRAKDEFSVQRTPEKAVDPADKEAKVVLYLPDNGRAAK
jgi:hypothetical protein